MTVAMMFVVVGVSVDVLAMNTLKTSGTGERSQ